MATNNAGSGSVPTHLLVCCFAISLSVLPLAAQPVSKPVLIIEEERQSDAELYCTNIAASAEEARLSWQTWQLVSLEAKVRQQVEKLERKQQEFEAWVERRERLLSEVEGHVVSIVSRMRPETAAAQLATTDEETAMGVLLKLKARVASNILDEMDPARAAQLTQAMVGFTDPEGAGGF
ncbi:MotE family protein [Labrenzia sp. CE80]|uniref:MotE family protein n=1 Tax=Labrenzia sp. CE80 TaxID=1788986 RepID=UPI0018783ACC|nr:MotE family protein [Labrenzia sp. CE80]